MGPWLWLLVLTAGCGRHEYKPPPPPEGVETAAESNVREWTGNGFVTVDGRALPPPPRVSADLWADPAVRVFHAGEKPGPAHVRMVVEGGTGPAAARVERSLTPQGWSRTGEIASERVLRRMYETADGSLAEMVVLDLGGGRTEVQLTLSPLLQPPPP